MYENWREWQVNNAEKNFFFSIALEQNMERKKNEQRKRSKWKKNREKENQQQQQERGKKLK